ncbi:putative amino acid permease 7 [Stylosanthes scabra]|uniref:Amino acid permease 7 n=1 Tax=Stylosanthes scabra TaxID=79078 RepID=A0ABU6UDW2_9FABA|nr:putative amino acid permease 7 [Stylosanthes scabra]
MVDESMEQFPLILHHQSCSTSSSGDDASREPLKRTGNVWSAVAHIITGVIGAGVLSLAWSVAQLGWIGGPLCILFFAATTMVSSNLLSDCYRYPHPEHGAIRSSSYMEAVKLYLGKKKKNVCGVLAYASLFGSTTAYVITSATSVK